MATTASPHWDDTPASDGVYIRTAEAAKILNRSPKTVSRWARDGKLPHLVTLGGHRRFPAAAVKDLARQLGIN
ncbi:MAG: hypothetical protein QOG21_1208 [Actinomycetota bacterium]|jgi:excisionase family DNA binding protein|nr:hypothetical protein [Actinomycetota bacterium]